MATERLIVKNFGPIREADLDLRKVTVLIGEQASGKSVLAKLVAIFRESQIVETEYNSSAFLANQEEWNRRISSYNLAGFEFNQDGVPYFEYVNDDFLIVYANDVHLTYKNDKLKSLGKEIEVLRSEIYELERKEEEAHSSGNYEEALRLSSERSLSKEELIKIYSEFNKQTFNVIYVPTERIIFSFVQTIPRFEESYLNEFAKIFERSVRLRKQFKIFPFDIDFYRYEQYPKLNEEKNFISSSKTGEYLSLSQASSGLQSLIPLEVVIETVNPTLKHLFIIEEPELNLYPTTQKKLVEYLIEKSTKGDNRLIVTTHSPYILTALNNCIEASNVLKSNPEAAAEVNKLVPPESQIAYEDVAAYFVANGKVKSIMNDEYQIIDANALDDVSDELSRVHGELLDLKYQHQD